MRKAGAEGGGAGAAEIKRRRRPIIKITDPVIISHPRIKPQIFERDTLVDYIKTGALKDYGITEANYRDYIVRDQFTSAVLELLKRHHSDRRDTVILKNLEKLDTYQDPISRSELNGDAVFARRDGHTYSQESIKDLDKSPFTGKPFRYPRYKPSPSWGLLKHPLYERIRKELAEESNEQASVITKRRLMQLVQTALRTDFTMADVSFEHPKLEEMPHVKYLAAGLAALHAAHVTAGNHPFDLNLYAAFPAGILYTCMLFRSKQFLVAERFSEKEEDDFPALTGMLYAVLLMSYTHYYTAGLMKELSQAATAPALSMMTLITLSLLHTLGSLLTLPEVSIVQRIRWMDPEIIESERSSFARLSPSKKMMFFAGSLLVIAAPASKTYEVLSQQSTLIEAARRAGAIGSFFLFGMLAPLSTQILPNATSMFGIISQLAKSLQAPTLSKELLQCWAPKLATAGMMGYLQFSAGASALEYTNTAFFVLFSLFDDAAVKNILRTDIKEPPAATDLFKVVVAKEDDASASAAAAGAGATKIKTG